MESGISQIRKKRGLISAFPFILILLIGISIGIFITQQKPIWFGLGKDESADQKKVDALVVQVGKLIALPTDETPTIVTVTDVSKVSGQQFFKNAKNEDVVLVYAKAQKAILYRLSENRIIEVGVVNPTPEPEL